MNAFVPRQAVLVELRAGAKHRLAARYAVNGWRRGQWGGCFDMYGLVEREGRCGRIYRGDDGRSSRAELPLRRREWLNRKWAEWLNRNRCITRDVRSGLPGVLLVLRVGVFPPDCFIFGDLHERPPNVKKRRRVPLWYLDPDAHFVAPLFTL